MLSALQTSAGFAGLLAAAAVLFSATAAMAQPADADLRTVRERFVRSVLPTDRAIIDHLIAHASADAKKLDPDGSWSDVNYAAETRSNWELKRHLDRTLNLAKAYRLRRSAGEDAPELKAAVDRALAYWLDHDFRNPNWWWNEIGTPLSLGETLMLLGEDADPQHVRRAVPILARSKWAKWTGQNLVWGVSVQVVRGCLENDADAVAHAFERMWDEVHLAEVGAEGIQSDHSFHQHDQQLYNGGYGLAYANDVGRFVCLSWGTRYQIPPEKMDVFSAFMLDGQQWMIRGGVFDYSAVGREIVRKGKRAVPTTWLGKPVSPAGPGFGLAHVVTMLSELPTPRQKEFETFAARLRAELDAPPLAGNRHFWRSDFMTHHRTGYSASVKMLSDRMINAELVNGEGRRSHHLSEGATFIYVTGEDYADVFPVWDWRKIPGTTAEQFELTDRTGIHFRGETPFVGGVSDGTYGLAAMDLKRGELAAKKAWAFFDDVIVCLGAGITCTTDNPVVTSIDQRRGDGRPATSHAGTLSPSGASPVEGVRWVHHDRVGYAFPVPTTIHVSQATRRGNWSDIAASTDLPAEAEIFALHLDHGVRPSGAAYAYLVLPDVEAAEVEQRTRAAEILKNAPTVQAVRHTGANTAAVAFWEASSIELGPNRRLAVDRPCLVLVREHTDGAISVTVSNPANESLTVNVTLGDVTTRFDLPDGPLAGSSVTQSVRQR